MDQFDTIRNRFLRHQAQTSLFPLMIEIKGSNGNYLIGSDGKRYLDLISGISVSHLGHGNETVKTAIINQLNSYMHVMVYGEFIQGPQVNLASKLCSLLPESLNAVYLLNSGAEATDVAMKLAKRFTGRPEVAACFKAYHGSTHAALSLNSEEYYKAKFRPLLPGIRFLTFNDSNSLEGITENTACFFVEVIRGEGGYVAADPEFLEQARQRCNETGTLLVFDEIQSGMGKTGKVFAFEHYGVAPDILLLGKALGAGLPIGAVISNKRVMDVFAHDPVLGHITTFGGNPVVASAALAGIEELERMNLLGSVDEKEQLFRSLLIHPAIRSVSGKGLMLGVELDVFDRTLRVISNCIENGLITDWFLFADNKIRISPPLTITLDEIRDACKIIVSAIQREYGELN